MPTTYTPGWAYIEQKQRPYKTCSRCQTRFLVDGGEANRQKHDDWRETYAQHRERDDC